MDKNKSNKVVLISGIFSAIFAVLALLTFFYLVFTIKQGVSEKNYIIKLVVPAVFSVLCVIFSKVTTIEAGNDKAVEIGTICGKSSFYVGRTVLSVLMLSVLMVAVLRGIFSI